MVFERTSIADACARHIDERDLVGELLSALQQTCLEATEAVSARYFSYAQPVAWAQEG